MLQSICEFEYPSPPRLSVVQPGLKCLGAVATPDITRKETHDALIVL